MHVKTLNACKELLRDVLTSDEYKEFTELLTAGLSPKQDDKAKIVALEQRINYLKANIKGIQQHLQRIIDKWEQPIEGEAASAAILNSKHVREDRRYVRDKSRDLVVDPHVSRRRELVQTYMKSNSKTHISLKHIPLVIDFLKKNDYPVDSSDNLQKVKMSNTIVTRLTRNIIRDFKFFRTGKI